MDSLTEKKSNLPTLPDIGHNEKRKEKKETNFFKSKKHYDQESMTTTLPKI